MTEVGKTIPHDSAVGHVTGQAHYIDDIPPRSDELHVGFVGSPVASGRLKSIQTARAAGIEGVVGIYTSQDVPHNLFGAILHDEPFLADEKVLYVGQPVVVVAAEDRATLRHAL